jgi:tetratricopeptide (TPR) repeat protein
MSSFDFKPDSQQQIPEMTPPRERIGGFSKIILAGFVLLALIWMAWGPIATSAKTAWARHHAKEAHAALNAKDWSRAVEQTIAARRLAPEDPEVMRAVVEFLKVSGSDPVGLAQQLRELSKKQALTEDEQMLLGRTLASAGKTDEARAVYDKLPLSTSTRKPGLELLSNILAQEGHTEEADKIMRRAAIQQPGTPETRMKLALEDARSGFIEIRRHAHHELLALARLESKAAMEAVTHLTIDPLLTVAEAQELLKLVEAHAHKSLPVRLGVISALCRLQPQQRESLIDGEIKRFQSGKEGALEPMARWLALEKQHTRLLKVVPPPLAAKSRVLYPIVAQALAEEGRWQELKEMLTQSKPPVSPLRVAIWQAEASSHLEPDLKEASMLLTQVVNSCTQEAGHLSELLATAVTAEKLSLVDIGITAYKAAADEAGRTGASADAMKLLQKAADLALLSKDSSALLAISQKLHQLRPSSAIFTDRLMYLRLVLGVEMETIELPKPTDQDNLRAAYTIDLERIPPPLLLALSAYRLGDHTAVKKHLAGLENMASLPVGPRAVAAGLLSLVGQTDRAYQMAEKIPGALLLEEERAFLKQAL